MAIDQNKPDSPLVIHSNMNVINKDKDNLEHKGNTVDTIMKVLRITPPFIQKSSKPSVK